LRTRELEACALTARGDVLGSRTLQRMLDAVHGFRGVAMDGKKCATVLDAAFIALGFVFGNTHSNQRPQKSSDGASRTESSQPGYDGAGGDERP
jgi:hypothetical protein